MRFAAHTGARRAGLRATARDPGPNPPLLPRGVRFGEAAGVRRRNERAAFAVCRQTEFVVASRLAGKKASTAASLLPREIFAQYGYVRYILADRGAESRNEVAEALWEIWGSPPRVAELRTHCRTGVAKRLAQNTGDPPYCSPDGDARDDQRVK